MDELSSGMAVSSAKDLNFDRMQRFTQSAGGTDVGLQISTTLSDLDLRQAKGELFSKLIEKQPQQMIVTPPKKTNSDENLANSSRSSSDISRLHQMASLKETSKCDVGVSSQADESSHQDNGVVQEPELFSGVRSKWYSNEEVASILTNFSSHPEWQSNELQVRPKSGAVLLYSREKVRYRQDGYCWKKRKNGRTTREDHMKLKVQGVECIYGCYVHSAILPTFHRRCYWLLENPDIVLVHYLNQPPDEKNKMILTFDPIILEADTRRRWTNEEIIEEIGSVFGGISQIHHTLSINFPTNATNSTMSQSNNDRLQNNVEQTNSLERSESSSGPNNNNDDEDEEMDLDKNFTEDRQTDQDPCSPVTQIYNKIVDDIETYVLPIEPNHFDPGHHLQHHHQHQHHNQNSHSNMSSSGVSIQAIDNDSSIMSDDSHRRFERVPQNDYSDGQRIDHVGSHMDSGQTECSIELNPCDLFGSCGLDRIEQGDENGNNVGKGGQDNSGDGSRRGASDDILLSDYNSVSNHMGTIPDLMMDTRSVNASADIGVDSNQMISGQDPLDLFNFKSNCEQLDVKSTISDSGTSNRLSPMPSAVPRCNSTDNALRTPLNHFDQYHHVSNQYLANVAKDPTNDFLDYGSHNVSNSHGSNASTEASNSTSCSASPSSSSLLPSRVNYLDSTSPASTYMKLPLQQRQNSEQKEPSNSVLNSLLPKALSLDGSDLSTSHRYYQYYHHNHHGHHHLRASPLIGAKGHSRIEHRAFHVAHNQNHNHTQLSTNQHFAGSHFNSRARQHPQQSEYFHRPSIQLMSVVGQSSTHNALHQQQNVMEYRKIQHPIGAHARALPILDYVPNWSPCSGGVKLLLVGNWATVSNDSSFQRTLISTNPGSPQDSGFQVLFDDLLVPASLIQDNVLRCYSPQHSPGFIALKVLYGELVVSEQVLFEIRSATNSTFGAASKTEIQNDHLSSINTCTPLAIKVESGIELHHQHAQQPNHVESSQKMDSSGLM